MKALIATQKPFAAAAVAGIEDILREGGLETAVLEKYGSQDELAEAVRDADALIIRSDKVTAEIVAAAPKLKIVVRAGAGYDNVDLEACSARGIVVMNTPGQNSNAVAELAIAMMIYMSRGQFTPATGSEIQGKTLGIQAFGNVGRLVAAKASALGMKVWATDPFLPAEKIAEAGAEPVERAEDLYSSCDFVSVHIPATPQTVRSIGYDLISSMPKGATLVNTARKEVIDEDGLMKALEECVFDIQEYEKFLEENASRAGVTKTESGLQYEILEPGNDVKATLRDTVYVHYTGTLIDGTVFDQTLEENDAVAIPLSNVIRGWQEGLPLVGEGGHIKLYVPSELGYGSQGNPVIKPNSALVFDVKVEKVGKAPEAESEE